MNLGRATYFRAALRLSVQLPYPFELIGIVRENPKGKRGAADAAYNGGDWQQCEEAVTLARDIENLRDWCGSCQCDCIQTKCS